MITINTDQQIKRNCSRRSGATVVEFALLLPVLLAILLGIIEFGWLITKTYTVGNATREGARFGALGKSVAETKSRVRESAYNMKVLDTEIVLQYYNTATSPNAWQTWPSDMSTGTTIKNGVPVDAQLKVTVATTHTPLTGFFPFLNNRKVTQSTVMRREL